MVHALGVASMGVALLGEGMFLLLYCLMHVISSEDSPTCSAEIVLLGCQNRLHNMRTVYALRPDRQRAVATETMQVWCSLAERLGMFALKVRRRAPCAALHPSEFCCCPCRSSGPFLERLSVTAAVHHRRAH